VSAGGGRVFASSLASIAFSIRNGPRRTAWDECAGRKDADAKNEMRTKRCRRKKRRRSDIVFREGKKKKKERGYGERERQREEEDSP
jgi:phage-related minor tail protein